ncbi:H-NS family nucleoid-associated regulatory protein [Variovorax paradoxus]|uniref:H-NS family nucleoid-associated regulatory protein n=1 Tax=Variovorax paradoxus TaxID=34073 RepID=UPI003ECE0A71
MNNERRLELAKEEEELKRRIAAIQREQIEEREKDLVRIVSNFKAELTSYELTLDDAIKLFDLPQVHLAQSSSINKVAKKSTSRITHREPNGPGTWAGVGRKPRWLVEAQAKGALLQSFEVPLS